MINKEYYAGFYDVLYGFRNCRISSFLAFSDIRQRYRRSSLGPFWITISTGVMIACIGLIFGGLFKSPMSEFLPFLTVGLIVWGLISSTIIEATTVFVNSESIIKQLPLPLFTHILRMIFRNIYIFCHNFVIFPLVCLIFKFPFNLNFFLFFPGLIVLILNLIWLSLFLGIICSRFRDLTQIVNSLLQVIFYVTPIIWLPSLLPARAKIMILDWNPFYHLIEIVRAPLLGTTPTTMNWIFSFIFLFCGSCVSIKLFNKYRDRIAYWL